MDTLENLRSKSDGAKDLSSVVKSMKAMAASNIVQYEAAVASLADYYRTVTLGIIAYLRAEKSTAIPEKRIPAKQTELPVIAIVFGSDQGLVGRFNDSMAGFVAQSLHDLPGKKEIWAVGERVQLLLSDFGLDITYSFPVPNAIHAITPLIDQLLIRSAEEQKKVGEKAIYIFHNQPKTASGYEAVMQRLLPLDEKWRSQFAALPWPTKKIPQIAGGLKPTLLALIREYLFASLFKACAESLASENASRLEAMQRAEKNIEDLLADLGKKFQRLRQSNIDEELFDVVSGFEALKKSTDR